MDAGGIDATSRCRDEIIINLRTIAVRDNFGMEGKDARRAQQIVAAKQEFLLSAWQRTGPLVGRAMEASTAGKVEL